MEQMTIQDSSFSTDAINFNEKLKTEPPELKGEVVRIRKVENDSDSDLEVDIDDGSCEINPSSETSETNLNTSSNQLETTTPVIGKPPKQEVNNLEELLTLDIPQSEVTLDPNNIIELEKVFNDEFFEGSSAKTPVRYLKIRNHILNLWKVNKPKYVSKTSVRSGLKNCGDVNSISRVHCFLEQIGAINFGCSRLKYVRPLKKLLESLNSISEKCLRNEVVRQRPVTELRDRKKLKKKFENNGEGGCTLIHDENGQVIDTTVVNEEPVSKLPRLKKPVTNLIFCREFTSEEPQEFVVRIELSALLAMDFHAHTSFTEVMGLVAGYWLPYPQTVTITHYEPCSNLASSQTHCDMCPVSQAAAIRSINDRGLDLLGWYHSHPTFHPEPSQQDLETQATIQRYIIGDNKPCLGVILSPYHPSGAQIASRFRCLVINKTQHPDSLLVPYKLKVRKITSPHTETELLCMMKQVLESENDRESRIDFNKPYLRDTSITHLEKYLSSVKLQLERCSGLTEAYCDSLVEQVRDFIVANMNR